MERTLDRSRPFGTAINCATHAFVQDWFAFDHDGRCVGSVDSATNAFSPLKAKAPEPPKAGPKPTGDDHKPAGGGLPPVDPDAHWLSLRAAIKKHTGVVAKNKAHALELIAEHNIPTVGDDA